MQKQKYSAELDKALTEYGDLKTQAADFDPVELYDCRRSRPPDVRRRIAELELIRSKEEETQRYISLVYDY